MMFRNGILVTGAIAMLLCAAACNDGNGGNEAPPPGTVLAKTSEPILEDSLNKSVFELKLIADSMGNGTYDVDVAFGPNTAVGKFTMPKGIENIAPIMKKGKETYTYIVGFKLPDDTAFYEYYKITGGKESIKMGYTNSYTFK